MKIRKIIDRAIRTLLPRQRRRILNFLALNVHLA
jgi:hypothetical protein